jgi:hypothetical protein
MAIMQEKPFCYKTSQIVWVEFDYSQYTCHSLNTERFRLANLEKNKTPPLQAGRNCSGFFWLLEDGHDKGDEACYQCHNGYPELRCLRCSFTCLAVALARNLWFRAFSGKVFVFQDIHLFSRRSLPAPSLTRARVSPLWILPTRGVNLRPRAVTRRE